MRTHDEKIRLSSAVAAAVLGGLLLASSTCEASFCSEDCDPCVSQCHCSNVCHHGQVASFGATHRLNAYELAERSDGHQRVQRIFAEIQGLSIQRAGGPAIPIAADLASFARGVLEVNAALLVRDHPSAIWVLDSVELYESAGVVIFHRENTSASDGARFSSNDSVSFLFDARGNLNEIDQSLGT